MKKIFTILTMVLALNAYDNYSTDSKTWTVFGAKYTKICIDGVFYLTIDNDRRALSIWINPKTLKPSRCGSDDRSTK